MSRKCSIIKFDNEIVKMYRQGKTVEDISIVVGISKSSVYSRIKELGVKKPRIDQLDSGKILALFRAGWSVDEIVKEMEYDIKREVDNFEVLGVLTQAFR